MVLDADKTTRSGSREVPELAVWLEQRSRAEKLSYRQMAARAGLSHATIAAMRKGVRPSAMTIVKLSKTFSDNGTDNKGMLEDYLLGICGYRSSRPELTLSEPLARLLDKLGHFDEEKLKFIECFVDFSATLGNGNKPWRDRSI